MNDDGLRGDTPRTDAAPNAAEHAAAGASTDPLADADVLTGDACDEAARDEARAAANAVGVTYIDARELAARLAAAPDQSPSSAPP